MKLILENFGAIQSCTIDLTKKHYLFVGYNNTGKTFLAKLLGELFTTYSIESFILSDYSKRIKEFIDKKFELADKSITSEAFILSLVTNELITFFFEDYASYLEKEFIKHYFSLSEKTEYILKNIRLKFIFSEELTTQKKVQFIIKRLPFAAYDEVLNPHMSNASFSYIGILLEIFVINTPILLPANRLFVLENVNDLIEIKNQFHKKRSDLFGKFPTFSYNQINTELHKIGLRPQSSKLDYWLAKVEELRRDTNQDFIQNGTHFWDTILIELAKVMGGDMQVAPPSSVSYNQANFKPQNTAKGEDLPLFLSSSSVNQLSLLYLYLKYWAYPDRNFLIIDEPEQNLHPKNQLALLEVLLSFASVGENRILLTTHSPLFAEMFNNYLLLGHIKDEALREKAAQELGLKNLNVTDENTGIYFFNGTKVIEQKIGDYGVSFQAFKEAKERVYKSADYLRDMIYEQNHKLSPK